MLALEFVALIASGPELVVQSRSVGDRVVGDSSAAIVGGAIGEFLGTCGAFLL